MPYEFRDAQRSNAKPLVGLFSESGNGKTYTALLLARGFVGPTGKIGMIETEGGRGEAYSKIEEYPEIGGYKVLRLEGEFAPKNYGQAIAAAEKAGLDALIIDSASHEWEGPGGVLAMAAQNEAEGKKGVLVWQQPKIQHQREFMLKIIGTPIPLVIVCMRAKYTMEQKKKPNGGMEWVRSESLEPKQSEDILYEMFVHGWIDKEHRFHRTKCTARGLIDVFKDGEPITLETGQQMAAWARGDKPAPAKSETRRVEPTIEPKVTPFSWLGADGQPRYWDTAQAWADAVSAGMARATPDQVEAARDRNAVNIEDISQTHPDEAKRVVAAIEARLA